MSSLSTFHSMLLSGSLTAIHRLVIDLLINKTVNQNGIKSKANNSISDYG